MWSRDTAGRVADRRVPDQAPQDSRKLACLGRFADEPVADIVQCGEPASKSTRIKYLHACAILGAPSLEFAASCGLRGRTGRCPQLARAYSVLSQVLRSQRRAATDCRTSTSGRARTIRPQRTAFQRSPCCIEPATRADRYRSSPSAARCVVLPCPSADNGHDSPPKHRTRPGPIRSAAQIGRAHV